MSDISIGIVVFVALFFLLLIRIPIGFSLIGMSFVGIWAVMDLDVAISSISIIPYNFGAGWTLSSVPLFLFLGYIGYHANLTQGMFSTARAWLSGIPGGLAIASVFGSAGFAAISGSSIACSAAMGRIAVPEMLKYKYDPSLATGTIAVAGTIGALIPPSILMILFGVIAQTSISKLFLGGVVAGIITIFAYIAVILVRVKLNPNLAENIKTKITFKEKIYSLKDTWAIFTIMIGIFSGLFSGVFTPNEAGAAGAFMACIVAALKKTLTWKAFKTAALETLVTTSAILIIATGASLLTRFMVFSGLSDFLADAILDLNTSEYTIMFGIVILYLLLGMFLEPVGAMFLTLPIIIPVVENTSFSLIWFGVFLTKLLEIGMITPPVGMNVFVVKSVVGDLVTTSQVFKGILWFLFIDLVIIIAFIYFPNIITFLPDLLSK